MDGLLKTCLCKRVAYLGVEASERVTPKALELALDELVLSGATDSLIADMLAYT